MHWMGTMNGQLWLLVHLGLLYVLCVEGTIMTRTDSAGVVKDMALQQGPGSAGTKIMFSTSLKG